MQREFDPRSFGVLISLITAINQVTYAFGPGVIGLLRDASGSYSLPFYMCIAVELVAAVLIMIRGRRKVARSPDGAQRAIQALSQTRQAAAPDYAALHPGYEVGITPPAPATNPPDRAAW